LLALVIFFAGMAAEKRPAADVFGSSQLVKRQKSDANLGGSSAVVLANGTGQNGALVQGVSLSEL
jgi:Prp8 binding protein